MRRLNEVDWLGFGMTTGRVRSVWDGRMRAAAAMKRVLRYSGGFISSLLKRLTFRFRFVAMGF